MNPRRHNRTIFLARVAPRVALKVAVGIVFAILSTSPAVAAKIECVPGFKGLSPKPLDANEALDRLAGLESDLSSAETAMPSRIGALKLPSKDAFQLTNEKHLELSTLKSDYETLADDLLSDDLTRIGNFESRIQNLRARLHAVSDLSVSSAPTPVKPRPFQELIDSPNLLKASVRYEVPQAAASAGAANVKKLSVSFTREVLDYFGVDAERGPRFLRAIQKGYVGSGAGSGIVRITDQHEALVEIKVIGGKEGHQRLIGCRRSDGYIEILKVYEKRNEGAGGSLKHFAELCEPR